MFPEFVGGDNTEDTNSEERPLYTLCSLDDENKVFPHTYCYLPSKAQWACPWVLENALPNLHPGTALQCVENFRSDADRQEVRAIESICGCGWKPPPSSTTNTKICPNATHGSCAWHNINRNFTNSPGYKLVLAAEKIKACVSGLKLISLFDGCGIL